MPLLKLPENDYPLPDYNEVEKAIYEHKNSKSKNKAIQKIENKLYNMIGSLK